MEYELKALELLISEKLNPKVIKIKGHHVRLLHECIMHAHTEITEIKMKFIEASFKAPSEKHFELYIQQHQRSLIQIADTLFNYQQQDNVESIQAFTGDIDITRLYTELYETIDALLSWIETRFYRYFDHEVFAPLSYRKLISTEIKTNMKYLQKQFVKHNISQGLIQVVLHPFQIFLDSRRQITYRELFFLKELQRQLFYILASKHPTSLTDQVHEVLLFLNYNAVEYFRQFIIALDEESKADTTAERIKFYSSKLKLINQLPAKDGFIYKPTFPPIKSQLRDWITEELYFLEKKQQFVEPYPLPSKNNEEPKVQTSLPVAHLSLAVRLLIDSKVITNKNATELMRIVARNFKTDRREMISEDSLRNKAYNIESSSVNGMKEVIKGLMNLVGRY